MDITIRVDFGTGEAKTTTFIGKKEVILPDIQKYIYENRHLHITVTNGGEDEVTYEELFLSYGKDNTVQKEKTETKD